MKAYEQMSEEELISFLREVKEKSKQSFGQFIKSSENRFLLNFILEKTKFLDSNKHNYSVSQRLWHVLNGIYDFCRCQNKNCGKILDVPSKFLGFSRGYRKYCCLKCSAQDEEVRRHYQETCLKKYGTTNVFSSEYGIKKIQETSIRKHGIPYFNNIEKARETRIKKHGGWHSKDFGAQVKKIKLEKYGDENYHNIAQARKTNFQKYGVEFPFHQNGVQERSTLTLVRRSYEKYILESEYDQPLFSFDEYFEKHRDNHNFEFEFRCKRCGNVFKSRHDDGIHKRCPICFPKLDGTSNEEIEVQKFISTFIDRSDILINNRLIIPPLELDLFIKNKKIAIEFDGLFWHSDEHQKRDYHLDKTTKCEEKGIRLIHIFEDEWLYKQDIVKSRLKDLLGIYDKTVFARKCEIREVDPKTSKEFQEENHLQGSCNSKVNIGLFFGQTLVSLMTFGKCRFDKRHEWELLRFCNKLGYHIPGGASRLLGCFERNYSPKSIVSYADRRWSQGNLYKALNFKFSHASAPNYWYFRDFLRCESRIKYQKHKLKDLLENFDPKLSEVENMKNNGYHRIFDCGNLVFEKVYI